MGHFGLWSLGALVSEVTSEGSPDGLPERQSRFAESDAAAAEPRGADDVSDACEFDPSPKTRTFPRTSSVRFLLVSAFLSGDTTRPIMRTLTLRQATNKDGIGLFRRFVEAAAVSMACRLNPRVGGPRP